LLTPTPTPINARADADPGTIRVSLDTKTTVPIGNPSRGKSRSGHLAHPTVALIDGAYPKGVKLNKINKTPRRNASSSSLVSANGLSGFHRSPLSACFHNGDLIMAEFHSAG